jgi:outer membrane receptor for ferrienterochelin and colicins
MDVGGCASWLRPLVRCATVSTLLLSSAVASADEPAPKAKDKETETVVVTGTRTPENVQRATVKTDVVTREEADRRGATNIAEVLATQPGLQVNPGSYGYLGGVSALQIQGFDRDRVLILEDGERVVGDVGGAIDLAAIPTADLERIEVVAGPTSSLYGSAALGGVVNIITGPPRRPGIAARGRAEYRSLNGVVLQGNVSARKDGALGPLQEPWVGLDANYTRLDGVERTPGLPDLRLPATDRRMIGVRGGMLLLRGGKGVPEMDVRIRMRAFRDRQDGIESEKRPGIDERFITDLPTQTNRYTVHVIHVTKFQGGASLRLTMGRQQFDNFTATDRRGSPIDERHDRVHRMQSFEAIGTIPEGPRTWVAGTRFEAEHFEQSLTQTVSTSTAPVTTTVPEVVPLTFGIAAFYAQLSWKIGQNLTIMPGVRTELHSRYGESVAPRLAAAWQITPKVTWRVSGGRGFRAPSAKELGFLFDHSVYGYRINGNRDLFPEKSWGVNTDLTVTPVKDAMLRGSVFANWASDLIDLDLGNGVFDGGIATYSYTNFSRARTAGGQIDGRFKPLPWLTAESSYAYTWTRDDVNDQPLPGRPPHSVTSALRVEPGWKLEMYVRSRIVTSSFLDVDTRSPGYQMVDARLGRTLWPHSQAYVGTLNLLDVKQDPNRLGDTRPPLGRILYVGLRADFPWED